MSNDPNSGDALGDLVVLAYNKEVLCEPVVCCGDAAEEKNKHKYRAVANECCASFSPFVTVDGVLGHEVGLFCTVWQGSCLLVEGRPIAKC